MSAKLGYSLRSQTRFPPSLGFPKRHMRAFASHNWGRDGANHARVLAVCRQLTTRHGLDVWVDQERMAPGTALCPALCRGIDQAHVVLVFVTCDYVAKVRDGDETDNVRREFLYAAHCGKPMIPIRFDERLPAVWTGPVGMVLGSMLYEDLSKEATADKHVANLARSILAKKPKRATTTRLLVRDRIARVWTEWRGNADLPAHLQAAVLDLVKSMDAQQAVRPSFPLIRKLEWLEGQLGLVSECC